LLTREEMTLAKDLGAYYSVPADNRDLNYNLYFSEGMPKAAKVEDYHSHNTRRLSVNEMMELLVALPEMRHARERRGVA
jgi:UDP-N-acetylglucosamine 4,6-dehydratase